MREHPTFKTFRNPKTGGNCISAKPATPRMAAAGFTSDDSGQGPCRDAVEHDFSITWVGVQELKLSYHNPQTTLFTVLYLHNMVILIKFLNSNPVTCYWLAIVPNVIVAAAIAKATLGAEILQLTVQPAWAESSIWSCSALGEI